MKEVKKLGVSSISAYKEKKEFWVPSVENNALFYWNLDQKAEGVYLGSFDGGHKDNSWQIIKILSCNERKYFFSRNSYELWELCPDRGQIINFVYTSEYVQMISNVEVYKGKAWIFANSFMQPIICLDLIDKTVDKISWNCDKEIGEGSIIRTIKYNNFIFTASRKKNEIYFIKINCETKYIEYTQMNRICLINCMEIMGESLWILCKNIQQKTVLQKYYIGDVIHFESEIELQQVEEIESQSINYFKMLINDNKVFLFPALSKKIVIVDLITKKEVVLEHPNAFYTDLSGMEKLIFSDLQQDEKMVYLFSPTSNQIIEVNMDDLSENVMELHVPEKEYKLLLQKLLNERVIIKENNNIELSLFLKSITKSQYEYMDKEKSVGTDIYNHLMKG